MKKLGLGAKILLSATAESALIIIASVIVFTNVNSMMKAQTWVTHTDDVIIQFKEILGLMIDMETGERGFLMSGEQKFLEPYQFAKSKFDESLKNLQNTVADNPAQVKRLDEIQNHKNNWI